MRTKTEAEIKARWQYHEPPLVSFVCVTYNHEEYIKDTIEGFLKQETDFPFEIIIQDDASTDNTANIIKHYVEKYPALIKPIFYTENQFSKHRKNVLLIAVPHARGNYIACCEGDDYWTDPQKIQRQLTALKQHPDCAVSFHPVLRKSVNGKRREKILAKHSRHNKIFNTKELVLGGGGFCPTASFIFKSSFFKTIPDWFLDAPIGDYFLQILSSLPGGSIYINQTMAVYRVDSEGSWSHKMAKDEQYAYFYFINILKSLDAIDAHTAHQYQKEFNIIRKKICFFMCRNPLLSAFKRKEIFTEHKHKLNFKNKIMWHLVYKNKYGCQLAYWLRNYILG